MKIYTPVKDFNGFRNNVRFINGVGETDDKWLIQWFVNHGYIIEKCEKVSENSLEKCDEPDFDSMTPNQLRDWMRENGYGSKIKNTRDKEKLLKILRG